MGALASRQNAGVEEADVVSNHAYKYPPRSGNYFGSHFIMGGERFDTPQPEAYLFGENADLNFLGSRPTPFPYPPPQSNEPTKTLKSLVNIRKESLRFVRCPEPVGKLVENNKIGDSMIKPVENGKGTYYNIEFTFDCDARIAITIFYFCTEEVTPTGVVYYPRDPAMTSQTYHYKKGANQQFCQLAHVFDPSRHADEELLYNADTEIIPVAIYCVVDEGQDEIRQSHTTIAIVEKHSDGTYVLKALKQKLFVDGLCYLLQEIYGIENKNLDTKPSSDEETEEGGSECVICMCDVRDTLILPCRHLCLCNSCADSLRYQANNCPICRAPFRALLQIRALQRATAPAPPASPPLGSMENIPAGYEPVSLIEALNGPPPARAPPQLQPAIASPDTDTASQAAEILNRCNLERSSSTSLGSALNNTHALTPEFRMSVLLAREQDGRRERAASPLLREPARVSPEAVNKSSLSLEYPAEASVHEPSSEDEGSAELALAEPEPAEEHEPDSDAERLSPLLTQPQPPLQPNGGSAELALAEPEPAEEHEPDSDAERLSPLLTQPQPPLQPNGDMETRAPPSWLSLNPSRLKNTSLTATPSDYEPPQGYGDEGSAELALAEPEPAEEHEPDSDAERLSPLLTQPQPPLQPNGMNLLKDMETRAPPSWLSLNPSRLKNTSLTATPSDFEPPQGYGDEGSAELALAEPEPAEEHEPDSDAERLSPLLTQPQPPLQPNGVGHLGARSRTRSPLPALAHIDDPDPDVPASPRASASSAGSAGSPPAEDSDYFTPEDTATTILTVPKHKHSELMGNGPAAGDGTPQRWALPHRVTSLPGTPLSQSSVRSSGDSYSSTSSTRQLLAAAPLPADTAC
ncbi:probable E3 ubiquitin-protein ligase MGRN1 [Cydia fagiglandana]|uniref:probable E3 ubiquitin-protein ligase MGRN1 n=1 Tax=Cydia fagiglandana TaxID=1458189 RepID=UPI002FEE0FE8